MYWSILSSSYFIGMLPQSGKGLMMTTVEGPQNQETKQTPIVYCQNLKNMETLLK